MTYLKKQKKLRKTKVLLFLLLSWPLWLAVVMGIISSGCYKKTFVICPAGNLQKCLKSQLPIDAKVVHIDSSSMEKGVYEVKYRR